MLWRRDDEVRSNVWMIVIDTDSALVTWHGFLHRTDRPNGSFEADCE